MDKWYFIGFAVFLAFMGASLGIAEYGKRSMQGRSH